MMSLSPGALSAEKAETYFEQHYSQDDYYTQGHTCIGRWIGKGSEGLGLSGEVERQDFSALLQGINPHSGTVLVGTGPNGRHAAGWDSVLSAPKSISIQALVGDDHRLIEAHKSAVNRALKEIELYALTRQTHNRERVVSANIVGAAFDHLAARPVADSVYGPDPQLHTHVILLNVTQRPDGQWRGLDPIEIYRSQSYGSAIYRSELAKEVQRLGYQIQITESDGAWELEGYTRVQVMAFSQRRAEIQEGMAAAGYTGAKAAQIVALQSRQAKRDYDESELKAEWKTRAAEYGIDARQHLWQARGRGDENRGNTHDSEAALAFAKKHTTEREAVVDRRDLEAAALQHRMGRVDLASIRTEIGRDQQRHSLIESDKRGWQHAQGALTTDEMIRLEAENLAIRRAGINQAGPIASAEEVRKWAASRGLSDEQAAAAEVALASHDQMTAIEGLAGTAKTYTVGAVREFAEARGYTVRGFGMTSGSVKELRKVGLDARTVASLTSNPVPQSDKPQLWFVDESSLLATRPVNQLLKLARRERVAVRVVGDQRQHLAIEAGHPMSQFLADGMPVAELTTIRRQRDAELRKAVEQASQGKAGAAARALDLLEEQQRLSEIPDVKERYRRIAAGYLRGYEAGQVTLVVSPGNDERRTLNQEIRKTLIEQGHVESRGRAHDILVPRQDMTKARVAYARYYDAGDVLHFDRAHERRGIAKDSYLTVKAVDRTGNLLTLQYSNGRTIEASPGRWGKGVQVYTHEQREIAVGDRIEYRIHDRKQKIANHQLATVMRLDGNQATLKFDSGRVLKGPLSPHIDLGYASTSHSAQGATVDRVIVNLDSMRSAQLVNQRSFYVTISRAREDAQIYTDDARALRNAVKREQRKEVALEVIQPPQQRQSTGLSIHR